MSRSRKKHPICGITTAKSEKEDKRIMNRALRHKANSSLKNKDLEKLENYIELKKDEIMNVWSMAKDGRQRIRKSSEYYKKAMRK